MLTKLLKIILIFFVVMSFAASAWAIPDGAGNEVFPSSNVGIGTTTPQGAFVVTNGNVGLGTWAPTARMQIVANGLGTTQVDSAGLNLVNNTSAADGSQQISPAVLWRGYGYRPFPVDVSTSLDFRAYVVPVQSSALGDSYLTFQAQTNGGGYLDKMSLTLGGNLGLGSVSPGARLDVQGDIRAVGNISATGTITGASIVGTLNPSSLEVTGTATVGTSSGNLGVGTTLTGGTAKLAVVGGNVGIGTITPQGAFVVTSGNVGIGTWSPGGPLEIASSKTGQLSLLRLHNTVNALGNVSSIDWVTSNTVTSQIVTTYPSGGKFGFIFKSGNGTPERMRISASGGVGIGTFSGSDPVQSLAVSGPIGIGTVASSAYVVGTPGPAGGMIVEGNVGVGTTTPQAGFVSMNNVGIGTWTAAGGNLIVNGGGNVGIGTAWPGVALDVNGTMRATSIKDALITELSGNVGIGSTSPTAALDVGGGINASGSGDSYFSTGNLGVGTTSPQASFVVTNGNVGIGTWTAAGGNLIVKGGGNVGIGTAWPGKTFEVFGDMRLTNSGKYYGDGSQLTGISAGSSQWFTASGVGIGTYDKVGLGTSLTGQTAKFAIVGGNVGIGTVDAQGALVVTNGNVGIGTFSPSNLFEIGSNKFSVSSVGQIGSNGNAYIGSGNGQFIELSASSSVAGNIALKNGSTAVINIPSGTSNGAGNVGVGTTTPQTALAVMSGNVGIGTWTAAGGNLIVNGGGNVGIGTAWPGVALDVNGTMRATSIKDALITELSGNVGIGSSIPSAALDVSGSITSTGSGDSYFSSGNLGVGTTTPQASFVVTNGNVGIGTWTATSGLQLKSSFAWYRTATAASVTSAAQTIIGVTSTAAARTITLATADVTVGRVIIVKDESGGAATNNITINTQGGQTIDGQASITISANYGVLRVYSDGSNWFSF